jgi:hypothetical protein
MSDADAETRGTVELSFKYTEEEYTEAARLFFSRVYDAGFQFYLGLVVMAGALVVGWLAGDFYIMGSALFVGLLVLARGRYMNSVLPRSYFRRNPKFLEPYQLTFSDDGLVFRSKGVESRIGWDYYTGVWETKDFYFLVYGKDLFSLIPKRVFRGPRQEAAFRELLRRKLPASAGGSRALEPGPRADEYVPPVEPPDWR